MLKRKNSQLTELKTKTITKTKIYEIILKRIIINTYSTSLIVFVTFLILFFYANEKLVSSNVLKHDSVVIGDLQDSHKVTISEICDSFQDVSFFRF